MNSGALTVPIPLQSELTGVGAVSLDRWFGLGVASCTLGLLLIDDGRGSSKPNGSLGQTVKLRQNTPGFFFHEMDRPKMNQDQFGK